MLRLIQGEGYLDCTVEVEGKISNRKGVNTPDSVLEISPLTPKDRSDLKYMLQIGVDWVALSFVQRPEDIIEINALIERLFASSNPSYSPSGQKTMIMLSFGELEELFEG